MTINSSSRTAGPFPGNGVTTDFPFSYKVFTRDDVLVALTVTATEVETIQILDSDYTVTLNANQNSNPGGTITMLVAPPAGTTLAATSDIEYTQTLDLTNGGGFYPTVINNALDRLVIQIQQLRAKVGLGLNIGAAAAIAALAIIQAKILRYKDVYDYGAVGTGLVSDSAAFQAGINALSAAGGGVLFVPPGRYLFTVNVLLKSNVSIRGAGIASRILLSGNDRYGFYAAAVEDVEISYLFIDGQKPSVGWQTTNNYDIGIRLGVGATSRSVKRVKIHHIRFQDIGLDGLYIDNCEDIEATQNHYINCRRWGGVVEGNTYGTTRVLLADSYFDCSNGSGPVGKEFPLGAVDCEPFDVLENVSFTVFRNLYSNMGVIAMQNYGSGHITDSSMVGITVNNARLNITNDIFEVKGCRVSGVDGYFIADISADGAITQSTALDIVFSTTRSPVLAGGRANLLPADFGNDLFFNAPESISGSGSSTGRLLRNIDGRDVYVRDMRMTAALGEYQEGQDLQATITIGDQIFMMFEIDRTDGNAATNNFFRVAFDTGGGANMVERIILPPQGISTFVVGFKAPRTIANPRVRWGLSGTAGAAIVVNVRKNFVLVNPLVINSQALRVSPSTSPGITDNAPSPVITLSSGGNMGVNNAAPTFPVSAVTLGTGTTAFSNCVAQFRSNAAGRDAHIRFGDNSGASAAMGYNSNDLYLYANGQTMLYIAAAVAVRPGSDNTFSMGTASFRWSVIYAGTGAINTSDERSKQDIEAIPKAVLRAWSKVNFYQYKFKDAVTDKGADARWHFGLIAQRVKAAFESEGLDAFAYGLLCYDEWEETSEDIYVDEVITNEAGEVIEIRSTPTGEKKVTPAGNRYGIRYEEALALECAYLRSRLPKTKD